MIATASAVAYAFPNSRKPAHALARQLGAPPHAFSSSVTVTPYCFVWLSLEQKMAHQQGRAMAARFPEDQELQQASLQLVAELWDALDFRRSVQERSEEHTSELQSLMRSSYAVFCLKKKKHNISTTTAH